MSVDTSLQAYMQIKPKLSGKRAQVYKVIADATRAGFDVTGKEMSRILHWEINTVVPRRRELEQLGLIKISCVRNCGVTGFRAQAWRTTP